jgi:RNA polymerase sigma-70 factor (ECF subfamily)
MIQKDKPYQQQQEQSSAAQQHPKASSAQQEPQGAASAQNEGQAQEVEEKPQRPELSKAEKDQIFQQEFFPHIDSLYNFAVYLSGNTDEAKDLLQETYLRAYRFIDYYKTDTNAKGWLIRILKNTFINEYRKQSKKPTQIDYDDLYNNEEIEESDQVDLRNEIFDSLIGDEVTNAINELPVNFKLIILLCDIENFKYEEIAQIIDIPIGTVRSRLHRARNMLKKKLADYARKKGFRVS